MSDSERGSRMGKLATSAAFEGLPPKFVEALKTLFDILDDQKTGLVKFNEIEARWKGDVENGNSPSGLPAGVLDSLAKVTPANGLLTFERFCAGLRIALLRMGKQDCHSNPSSVTSDTNPPASSQVASKKSLPTSSVARNGVPTPTMWNSTAAPNLIDTSSTAPTTSSHLPGLPEGVSSRSCQPTPTVTTSPRRQAAKILGISAKEPTTMNSGSVLSKISVFESSSTQSAGKLKPASSMPQLNLQVGKGPPKPPRLLSRTPINHGLGGGSDVDDPSPSPRVPEERLPAAVPVDPITPAANRPTVGSRSPAGASANRSGSKRREPRRHTLQGGVDHNMLRRLQQVEAERDMLLRGLQVLERAREWYHSQLAVVNDKMKDIARHSSSAHWDYSSEAYLERMNFQRARISEANAHLTALTESNEKGFPLHMNLALRNMPPQLPVSIFTL
ncbi:unnamed protein product [Cyprideis torosa]|uniref:Suppressor APC domain-containing protein n=1 Tax=Cyprideis torosa TaxID=163714 RepID=A0A7R8WE15_9CRUS|nr:unnamed protein product [Cyprideis torosa]CAG0893808.1 unnamed protein product [Cyprideis torosa]